MWRAGASDAAACVGVALEVARLYAADANCPLAAPLIVLLNGGEETFLQARRLSVPPRCGACILYDYHCCQGERCSLVRYLVLDLTGLLCKQNCHAVSTFASL